MNPNFDYQPYFNRFIGEVLPLDATRVERINDAWSHLDELIAGDIAFRSYWPQIVAQGSYAVGTAIRPFRARDEFDVDLLIKLTLPTWWGSRLTLDWLHARLASNGVFKSRLVEHPRCVRVSYAGDFHLDIVPARRTRVISPITGMPTLLRLKVPDRTGGWRFSNPEGFVRWCQRQDRRTGGDFSRVVMLLKRWRDINVPEKRRIRSIVFTTLIGLTVPSWKYGGDSRRPDADILTATLGLLDRRLRKFTAVPRVMNPSLASENLARNWTKTDFRAFCEQIREAHRLAVHIRSRHDPTAWRMLFGGMFPKAL